MSRQDHRGQDAWPSKPGDATDTAALERYLTRYQEWLSATLEPKVTADGTVRSF